MNIEILRNTLYKAYLDDFSNFCRKLGGATAEIMNDILSFEVNPHGVQHLLSLHGTQVLGEAPEPMCASELHVQYLSMSGVSTAAAAYRQVCPLRRLTGVPSTSRSTALGRS